MLFKYVAILPHSGVPCSSASWPICSKLNCGQDEPLLKAIISGYVDSELVSSSARIVSSDQLVHSFFVFRSQRCCSENLRSDRNCVGACFVCCCIVIIMFMLSVLLAALTCAWHNQHLHPTLHAPDESVMKRCLHGFDAAEAERSAVTIAAISEFIPFPPPPQPLPRFLFLFLVCQ